MKRLLYSMIIVIIPCSLHARSMLLAAIPLSEPKNTISIRETMQEGETTAEQCQALEQHRNFYKNLQELAPERLQKHFDQRSEMLKETLEHCEYKAPRESSNE